MSLEPLTDYSKFKAECENILFKYKSDEFTTVVIRPATVCGYSRRQRLDVIVNILTNLAIIERNLSFWWISIETKYPHKDMINHMKQSLKPIKKK